MPPASPTSITATTAHSAALPPTSSRAPPATSRDGGAIKQLIDRDLAYVVDGDVYYSVNHFAGYGELSRLPREELLAGARKEVDGRKRDPADFALWKAAKPGEPSWDSPWGPGRPGWHIECSAMSEKYLGPTFDLHGGGIDPRFPHHENERAQAQGVHGPSSFSRYWMHNGFVGFRWVHNEQVMAEGQDRQVGPGDARSITPSSPAPASNGTAARRCGCGFDDDLSQPDHLRRRHGASRCSDGRDWRDGPGAHACLEEAERRLEYGYLTMQRLDEALAVGKPVAEGHDLERRCRLVRSPAGGARR